jgi:hypothetical protein
MKLTLAVIFTGAFLLINSSVSLACVCNVRSVGQRKTESQAVFLGAVMEREQESTARGTVWRTKFAVERYWKGAKGNETTIYTSLDDCASSFEVGKKYLVFAFLEKKSKHLETDSCMGTGRLEMVKEDLKKLGKGKLMNARP